MRIALRVSRFIFGIATRADSSSAQVEKSSESKKYWRYWGISLSEGRSAYMSALHKQSVSASATFRNAGRIFEYRTSPCLQKYFPLMAP